MANKWKKDIDLALEKVRPNLKRSISDLYKTFDFESLDIEIRLECLPEVDFGYSFDLIAYDENDGFMQYIKPTIGIRLPTLAKHEDETSLDGEVKIVSYFMTSFRRTWLQSVAKNQTATITLHDHGLHKNLINGYVTDY